MSEKTKRNLLIYTPVTLLAAILRLIYLGKPNDLMFDERYYVIQAYALKTWGTEQELKVPYSVVDNPSVDAFVKGSRNIFSGQPYFSPHPPLGKWFLSLGQFFGTDAFWWRIPVAVFSIIGVILFTSICRSWFKNDKLAFTAGMLFAGADTLGLMLNRLGILDTFLEFLTILAVFVLVKSKQLENLKVFSKWNYLVVAVLGLSCGVKWSGVYYLLAMIGFIFCQQIYQHWDTFRNYRNVLSIFKTSAGIVGRTLLAVIIGVLSYAVTWTGWFVTDRGYFRHWSQNYPKDPFLPWMPDTLRSWLLYHKIVLETHEDFTARTNGLTTVKQWFFDNNEVTFYTQGTRRGMTEGAILANPVIWWILPVLLVVVTLLLVRYRKWSLSKVASLPVILVAVGYLPWLVSPRIAYTWYQLPYAPWIIMTNVAFYVIIKQILEEKTSAQVVKTFRIFAYVWVGLAFLFAIYWIPKMYYVEIPWRILNFWPYKKLTEF